MQHPTRIRGQPKVIASLSCFVLDSAYLWAQRIVVIDAWLLVRVDASILELEERLHRDVDESEGGYRGSVGGSDVRGRCAEPRCNCGIDPVRLAYGQTARVLLLKVVPAVVSSYVCLKDAVCRRLDPARRGTLLTPLCYRRTKVSISVCCHFRHC